MNLNEVFPKDATDIINNQNMDKIINFHELDKQRKITLLEGAFARGKCSFLTGGMCGEIYLFDQGVNTFPRYSCIKIPKPINGISNKETAQRFIRELELQLTFYHNKFVHSIFDVDIIYDIPIASFRYWGNDLANLIKTGQTSQITKISLLIYTCIGLRHCYRKGLIAHQDLKPANIFIQNIKTDFVGLPDLDVFNFAKVADFGLANAFLYYGIHDGSRPYMAPEQWNKGDISQATDIFALGVIFYELMTDGYHPVGIKLNDYWPMPKDGNTKKWTRPDDWQKWISKGCKITRPNGVDVDQDILNFIEKMLSVAPSLRPTINEIIEFLLEQMKSINLESYSQLHFLITQYEEQSSKREDLKMDWPYLDMKREKLKNHFK